MPETKPVIATVTLELNVVFSNGQISLDKAAEMALQGAVNAIPGFQPTGTGFNYQFNQKKSRRGLIVTPRGSKL